MFVKGGPNTTDALLSVTTLFAAAAATATSNAIDLGEPNPALVRKIELEVNVPALPTLLAGQSIAFRFRDSADGVTFADLPISFAIAGVASTGAAATSLRFGLASTTRQYIELTATEAAGGADLTALSFEFHPVFSGI